MKGVLTPILVGVAILLAISSCATVPKGPLEEGELRLLSMDIPDNLIVKTDQQYWVTIDFEADGKPEIRRACMTWSGDGPYCVPVKKAIYGSDAYMEVPIYAHPGQNRLECYVEYVQGGKIRRTNTLMSYVTGSK